MKSDEAITWIMAVRNGLPHLPETLQAIAGQTYRNSELLIWDNGSTDGTLEVLHEWVPERIPGRIVSEEPLPLGESRAKLVELSRTEWCASIDADDVCLPERLQVQLHTAVTQQDLDVIGSDVFIIDDQGYLEPSLRTFCNRHEDIVTDMLFETRCPFNQPSVLMRRQAILDVGNYRWQADWDGCSIEDWDLWLRLFAAGKRFANVSVPLVKYRVHGGSVTVQSTASGRIQVAGPRLVDQHLRAFFRDDYEGFISLRAGRMKFAIPAILSMCRRLLGVGWKGHPLEDGRFISKLQPRIQRLDLSTRVLLGLLKSRCTSRVL